jgi:sugar phosphate isomerase/epimerase
MRAFLRPETDRAMIIGYNTNGLQGCSSAEAIELLAAIGYRGIAITLDSHLLNPFAHELSSEVERTAAALNKHQFRSVIETGARFLLDPRVKHEPTLVSPDAAGRARRVEFLCRAIDVAADLGSDCVSLWSGMVRDGADDRVARDRLVGGLLEVLEYADQRAVTLAFEPEPGMFIDTMARYSELQEALMSKGIGFERFRLTIDIGHLHCQGEVPIADQLRRWGNRLANVHIEDMRSGVHEHLMFGDGEIHFPPIIAALDEIGYDGLVGVELSRHGHEGPAVARQAYQFLKPLLPIT